MNAAVPQELPEGRAVPLPTVELGNGLVATSAAFSARGMRPYNEDRLGCTQSGVGYWALADGLGGHAGGAQAAELAVETSLAAAQAGEAAELEARLKQAVSEAHSRILSRQKADPVHPGMRTTLVLLGTSGKEMAWAHTGDSRLYHFRDGKLLWRTRDHSVVQLLIAAGEIAESEVGQHPERSRLISCLGGDNALLINSRSAGAPQRGDALLLCSDGLWEHFETGQMEQTLARNAAPAEFLESLAAQVEEARHPSQDNYTAIAVFVTGP